MNLRKTIKKSQELIIYMLKNDTCTRQTYNPATDRMHCCIAKGTFCPHQSTHQYKPTENLLKE